MNFSASLMLASLLATTSLSGATEISRILVPITTVPITGVNQSVWTSEFWAYNTTSCSVVIKPSFTDDVPLPAGWAIEVPIPQMPPFRPPGIIVEVHQPCADATLFFSSTVREHTSDTTVEIPVINVADFFSSPIHLLNIAFTEGARGHLRIYADPLRGTQPVVVLVRIYDQASNTLIHEEERTLSLSNVPAAAYSEMLNVESFAPKGSIRIEISPLTADAAIWSFLSVTDASNHVRIATPGKD